MYKWVIKEEKANIELMSQTLKISQRLAQILVNRGIRTKNTAIRYLNPKIDSLHDTKKIKHIDLAVKLLLEVINKKGKIVVFGDYDVDGVVSVVILYKTLKLLGADVTYYIPHREQEGYGLNMSALKALHEAQTDLIIACDNGIAALDEIKYAIENNIKVIIIDHHEPSFLEDINNEKVDVLPIANAIIDPKQKDCTYPFKNLCAGGLVYKFVKYLLEYKKMDYNTDEFLVLAMISTFCDVVDLKDENRIIAKNGLKILNENKSINLGLHSLIEAKGFLDSEITNFCIGFIIGPCINASGRLDRATLAVELLTTDDPQEAKELAERLCVLNENRKVLTQQSTTCALEQLRNSDYSQDRVIVFFDPKIHESIIGIVAGRIKDQLSRPTIVFTRGEKLVKGSARSIEGYNIYEELFKCRDLFERFGGHPVAAGISLKEDNISFLRERLNAEKLEQADFSQVLYLEQELDLADIVYELAKEINYMEPFGKGNEEPLFLTRNISPFRIKCIENKATIIFTFLIKNSNRQIKAISFGLVDLFRQRLLEIYSEYETEKILCGILRNSDLLIDIVYSIQINNYNGDVSLQLRIKDFIVHRETVKS